MAEPEALESVHAARRAVTKALAGDVAGAIREIVICRHPRHAARALLGIAVGAIRTASSELEVEPAEVWQALALRQARYTDTVRERRP